jgi:hypothetical protein
LISGGGTSEALLETHGGLARIEVTASDLGEVRFRVEDPDERGIVFRGRIEEDFEAGDGGFIHGGVPDEWKWGMPSSGPRRAHSGEKAWWMERSGQNGSSRLQTPVYEVPPPDVQPVFLEFWHWFHVPAGGTAFGVLAASVDGRPYDWIPGVAAFQESVERYQLERISLAPYAGHSVRFRFILHDSAPGSIWVVDSLRLTGLRDSLKVVAVEGDEDRDGSSNQDEALRGSDPCAADSDGDGLDDRVETNSGRFTAPDDTGSNPLKVDSDGGGMRDDLEVLRGLDPNWAGDDFGKMNRYEVLFDAEGHRWELGTEGINHSGTVGALRDSHKLVINGRSFPQQPVLQSRDERNWVLGPKFIDGLEVTRDIFVPDRGDGYCRYLEFVRNPSEADVEAVIEISGRVIGRRLTTSSGDRTFTVGDHWVVLDDRAGGYPYVSLVASSRGAPVKPAKVELSIDQGTFNWSYNVRIPAGKTIALLHFAAQSWSESAALKKARELGLETERTSDEIKKMVLNFAAPREEIKFHRGDLNNDGKADVSDGLCLLEFLFASGRVTCREAADTNNDGRVDCSDVVSILGYLFLGTKPPVDPGPPGFPCGPDPDEPGSPLDLGCESYATCAGG